MCCIGSISSGKPVETSWAALLEGTLRDLGFRIWGCSLLSERPAPVGGCCELCPMASPSSLPSPACHTFWAGFAVLVARPAPCGTSLRRGCPLCCGCFKEPRLALDSLRSSWALSEAQPAQGTRRMGSQERGTDL